MHPKEKEYYVREVISPTEFILDNGEIFKVKGLESLDPYFSSRNKELASKLNLSEEDAVVTGTLVNTGQEIFLKEERLISATTKLFTTNSTTVLYL